MTALNSAFKHTRERMVEILAAAVADFQRGATDVPCRGCERCDLKVYLRRRKNDEAQIKCCVDVPDLGQADELVTDSISARRKLLVVEAAWNAVVRRRIAGEVNFLTLLGKTSTRLDAIERENGEVHLRFDAGRSAWGG